MTTPIVRPDLDTIEARATAATEGPWVATSHYGSQGSLTVQVPCDGGPANIVDYEREFSAADAKFITAARTDVPALTAYARELEARLRAAQAATRQYAASYANERMCDDEQAVFMSRVAAAERGERPYPTNGDEDEDEE